MFEVDEDLYVPIRVFERSEHHTVQFSVRALKIRDWEATWGKCFVLFKYGLNAFLDHSADFFRWDAALGHARHDGSELGIYRG